MRVVASCVLALALTLSARGAETRSPAFDFGFLASRRTDVTGAERLRVLGPFFESAVATNGTRLWAFRPFYSSFQDPAADRKVRDIVWPIASSKQFKKQFSWRLAVAYYLDYERTNTAGRYRFWVLPVYFQGRDAEGRSYAALFPLGGTIHDFLFKDEIHFFLWPLTAWSRVKDMETRDILWPIWTRSVGEGVYRWKIFPLYGYARRDREFEKWFALWPIYTRARYYYPGSSGSAYVVFPLWGRMHQENQDTWMFVPPFIRFTRSQRQNTVYAVWPFIQLSSGEKKKFYIWPLYGDKQMKGVRRQFYLWPFVWRERIDRPGGTIGRRFSVVPILQSESRTKELPDDARTKEVVGRYVKIWPLMSYRREEATRRVRLFDLWPAGEKGPIERSYAPIWTVYSRTSVGESFDEEFFWGLCRRERRAGESREFSVFPLVSMSNDDGRGRSREWSLLKGLLGYRREGTHRSLRVLYFLRFGGKEPKP